MDVAGRLLGVFKELPLWLFAALSAVIAAAWLYEPLQVGLPTMARASLPLLIVFFVIMTLCRALAHVIAQLQATKIARIAEDRQRLEQIYAPSAFLFTRTHVTACTGIGAPRLRHRLSNAWDELMRCRRVAVGVRRALRAIVDRRASTSAEVEFGGDFPLEAIHSRVVANPALSGPILLDLVRRADRSRYEENCSAGMLTDDEYALFEHIHAEHQRLARRLR